MHFCPIWWVKENDTADKMSAKYAAMWWDDDGNQENGKWKEDKRGKQWPMSTTSDTAFSFIFGEGPLKWTLTLEYLKREGEGTDYLWKSDLGGSGSEL